MSLFVLIGSGAPLDELGGKGYHLSRMVNLGLPVPPGIIIPTSACRRWMEDPKAVETELAEDIPVILDYFSKPEGGIYPVSIRSGAKFSMPGMMDTILNLGIECPSPDEDLSEEERKFRFESLHRFFVMYGNVVCGAERSELEREPLVKLIATYGTSIDLLLFNSIVAVFKSWGNERAKVYRELHKIPHDLGTAVIIQRMVFGNLNEQSATGVLFTRNPASGEDELVGEYLVKAQGEDIVAGIRTPEPISTLSAWNPGIAAELFETAVSLETKSKDVQDIEFTVEDGKLWILQTRNAKRTSRAAVRIVKDLFSEGLLSYEEMVSRLNLKMVLEASVPEIEPSFTVSPLATGIGASSGVASGIAVFSKEEAVKFPGNCILVTEETNPDDIPGINAAVGILTATGGSTSHAAVVARGLNKVAVVGCSDLKRTLKGWILNGQTLAGKLVTIDGATGRIWVGIEVPILSGENADVAKLKELVRNKNRKIWKLAESAEDVAEIGTIYRAILGTPVELIAALGKMQKGVIDLRGMEDTKLSDFDETILGVFGEKSLLTSSLTAHGTALLKKSVKRKEIYLVLPDSLWDSKSKFESQGYKPVRVSDDPATILASKDLFGLEQLASVQIYNGLSKAKKANGSRVFPLFYTDTTSVGVNPLTDTALLQCLL